MEFSGPQRPLDENILRKLANSVEVLGNIFYLVEMHVDHPDQIAHFMDIGKPALAELQDFVRRQFVRLN